MTRGRRRAEDVASFKGMGLAIEKLRAERGMSQVELAAKIELQPGWLSRIEAGKTEPKWGTLRKIAYALEIPLGELLKMARELAPGRGGGWWRRRERRI